MLGSAIEKIGCFFLDYFMMNVQSLHKNIKAVCQCTDTLPAAEDVGNCIKARKALGGFCSSLCKHDCRDVCLSFLPFFRGVAFQLLPFWIFLPPVTLLLSVWLILPGSETYWQGTCFYLCPQRTLTNWKKAPENTTSLARNITTASACTGSASTPSTRRSRPAGNASPLTSEMDHVDM